MSNPIKDIEYSDNVNCKFSEAAYQRMVSKRYGIAFCCQTDLTKWMIKKELLRLNDIKDAALTPVPKS